MGITLRIGGNILGLTMIIVGFKLTITMGKLEKKMIQQ